MAAIKTFIAYQHKPYIIYDDDEYPDCIPSLMAPIPCNWVCYQMGKLFFVILFVCTFLWFLPFTIPKSNSTSLNSITFSPISSIIHDLTSQGIIKTGNKAMFFAAGGSYPGRSTAVINATEPKMFFTAVENDDSFDFVFTNDFRSNVAEVIDKAIKVGGVLAVQLSNNPTAVFQKPENYRIVYLRHYGSTFMAMRKTHKNDSNEESPSMRRLLGGAVVTSHDAKKAALKNLEDALLEPPRGTTSGKSNKKFLKRTKYLPNLLGDSFENYPRRIFIDVDLSEHKNHGHSHGHGHGNGWFEKHYPTRNKDFDIYNVEAVESEEGSTTTAVQMGMSEWLKKNVKEEEYVVMKAEAEVVEEMVKNGVLGLVDELFLECKHDDQLQGLINGNKDLTRINIRKGRRAYWQCLALYGRLMDEGVAVHQWWG